MEDLGLPVEILIDDTSPNVPPERRAQGMVWSDIVWLYQATDPMMRFNINSVKKMAGFHDEKGKLWVPANYIVDSDDDLFNVSPWNWAFRTLGIRDQNGAPLRPGTTVNIETHDGKPAMLWKDGHDGFSIRDNITKLEDYRSLCKDAGIMTCSTPRTKEYIEREMGKDMKTFINPNTVRFDDYQDVALAPHKEVRIMWQGSNTHYEDIYNISGSLKRVLKKHPEAKLVFWGDVYGDVLAGIPKEQLEQIPWMKYDKYHLRLVTIGPDISICPLLPTVFNNSRSAIKWYEASLLHDPAATIAQRAGAYQDEIEHGKTGLLFDTPEEFEERLSQLIEDEKYRRELAANAKDWVHENRDAFKQAPKLFEFFEEVRANKRETCEIEDGPVSAEQPDVRAGEDKDSESS